MGIEPTPSAWKAEVLPLNYTRELAESGPALEFFTHPSAVSCWWRGKDSNLRRQSRQIYSLIPLTAWVPLRFGKPRIFVEAQGLVKANCP
jgi:hypothetical protein